MFVLDWAIDKTAIRLEQLLGDGQFGIVYRGTYVDKDGKKQPVAVKVWGAEKESQDISEINKYLLDEACKHFEKNWEKNIRKFQIPCNNSITQT